MVDGINVWIATTWGNDWTKCTRLIPETSERTDGGTGHASFRLLRKQRNDGTRDIADTFAPARGMYVLISLDGADPFTAGLQWAGQILSIDMQPIQGADDEIGTVDAIELGSVLEQVPIAHLCQRNPAGGTPLTLLTNPSVNISGSDGQVIGNCYTGQSPAVFESVPDNIGTKWSRYNLLAHVLTYAVAGTSIPALTLSASSALATYLQIAVAEVIELDTLNLKSFLDLLVGPVSGGTWKLIPHASNWTITIDSASDTGFGSYPAAAIQDVTLDGDDADLAIHETDRNIPDAVEVIGAPIVYCGTVSVVDGSLGQGWSASQQAAYIAGASGAAGYGAYATAQKLQLNRNVRKSPLLLDTFARFELKRNTPTADLQCSSASGLPAAGQTQPLCPAIIWDGSSTSVDHVNGASPYLPTARVLPILPIPLNDTTASASGLNQPRYMEPLVYRFIDPASPIDAWSGWSDLRNPPARSWDTPHVSVDDRGPVIRIEYDHQETLARADWTGTPAITEKDPTLTTSYGATDWRSLVATVAVEGDQRVRASVTRSGVTVVRNTQRIYRKDLHCWLVRSSTIVGLKADTGANFYGGDVFTRDDHPVAQRLANEAAAFAFRSRAAVTITLINPGTPPSWADVGTIIGTIDDHGNSRVSNTVVRSVRKVWDPRKPRVIISTDFLTAPQAGGGVDVTRVSLGGSVPGALTRSQFDIGSVSRDVQGHKLVSAASGQRDQVAKTFAITKTGHGWSVGTWVAWNGIGGWVAADRTTAFYDGLAMVVEVVDANQVNVAHGSGLVYAPTLTYTNYTPYFLGTAGAAVTPSPDTSAKVAPVFERLLFWAIDSHWIWLAGSVERDGHNHHLGDGADVKITTPANSDTIQYDSATQLWKNVAGGSAILGSRAALSVIGRAGNSAGSAADIAASTTGDVLQMGASSLSWGQLQTASYAALSVTAAKLGTDVVLGTLNDVLITSVAANDLLRYDSGTSKWKNYNLGPMVYASGNLTLDGGSGGTAINAGMGAAGSRFIMGGPGSALDFILTSVGTPATDICARVLRTSTTAVSFYDQAVGASNGTKVMEWGCDASAYASRYFRSLIPLQLRDNSGTGSKHLIVQSIAAQSWTIGEDVTPSQWMTLLGASADVYGRRIKVGSDIDFGGGGYTLFGDRSNGTSSSRLNVSATDGFWTQTGNLIFTGATVQLVGTGTSGVYVGTATTDKVGFWGTVPVTKTSVSAPSAVVTAATAGATYTATEQGMLNNLKTDVTNLRSTLNLLRAALAACGAV